MIFIIKDPESDVLLLEYRDGEDDPYKGFFIIPGGGFEEDENLDEVLSKELFEEAGVNLLSILLVKQKKRKLRGEYTGRT